MPKYRPHPAAPGDIPRIMALQLENQRLHPQAEVVSEEMLLSPGYGGGKYIICAVDNTGKLAGYIPICADLVLEKGVPHLVWANMKIAQGIVNPGTLRDLLLEQAVKLVNELTAGAPGHGTRLMFQYHVSEVENIDYVLSRGAVFMDSVMRMTCDLADEPVPVPTPPGIDVRYWKMETEAEQRAYVAARNEAFPHMPVTLSDWQHSLRTEIGNTGTSVGAFDGAKVTGCVSVYWDDAENRLYGKAAGWTEDIFVREAWRGRGVADCMISKALVYLKTHGLKEAQLDTGISNQRAIHVYKRMGYKIVDESRQYCIMLT